MVQRTRGNVKTITNKYRFKAFKARRSVTLRRRVVDGLCLFFFSLHAGVVFCSLNLIYSSRGEREGELWLVKKDITDH